MAFLNAWIEELWAILIASGWWLLLGFLLAGVVHVLLPAGLISRWLGGRGLGPVFKAALIGVPLPLCSCSVIPLAAGLRRQGAGKGASASFAIATPESGVDSIALTYAMLGPAMALLRPLAALSTALGAGALIAATDRGDAQPEPTEDEAPAKACCAHEAEERPEGEALASCCGPVDGAKPTVAGRALEAVRYGWWEMPRDLATWLIVGFLLSGLIGAAIPDGWLGENVGAGLLPMLVMLVAGLPVYVCAIASTPVAAALVAKGLSPGAALVLLLAGPATNMATMAWVAKDLGWRALAVYVGVIATFSVAFGLAVDALIGQGFLGGLAESFAAAGEQALHEHGPAAWQVVAAALTAALLVAAALSKILPGLKPGARPGSPLPLGEG